MILNISDIPTLNVSYLKVIISSQYFDNKVFPTLAIPILGICNPRKARAKVTAVSLSPDNEIIINKSFLVTLFKIVSISVPLPTA